MRVMAAVHALWLCGTGKCPFGFATDGDLADSENMARMDLLSSFSTADAVDIRSELTRVVRLETDRLVGPVVALAEQNAIDLVRAVVTRVHWHDLLGSRFWGRRGLAHLECFSASVWSCSSWVADLL